jgi:hypothetical protein
MVDVADRVWTFLVTPDKAMAAHAARLPYMQLPGTAGVIARVHQGVISAVYIFSGGFVMLALAGALGWTESGVAWRGMVLVGLVMGLFARVGIARWQQRAAFLAKQSGLNSTYTWTVGPTGVRIDETPTTYAVVGWDQFDRIALVRQMWEFWLGSNCLMLPAALVGDPAAFAADVTAWHRKGRPGG